MKNITKTVVSAIFLSRIKHGCKVLLVFLVIAYDPAYSAIIAADGGITIWLSYDNLDSPGTRINDNVTQVDSTAAASCTPTNDARAAQGEPDSPGSTDNWGRPT